MKSTRHWLFLSVVSGLLVVGASFILTVNPFDGLSRETVSDTNTQTFHIVTGEYKTTTKDGQELEAYHFSPGHITVRKGDEVTFNIHGINGESHHFQMEEFGISGTVEKGKTTTVTFVADQVGTFELMCTNHATREHDGPMVAYVTVLE